MIRKAYIGRWYPIGLHRIKSENRWNAFLYEKLKQFVASTTTNGT